VWKNDIFKKEQFELLNCFLQLLKLAMELEEDEIAIKPLVMKRKEIQYEKQLLEEEFEKFKEEIRNSM